MALFILVIFRINTTMRQQRKRIYTYKFLFPFTSDTQNRLCSGRILSALREIMTPLFGYIAPDEKDNPDSERTVFHLAPE